MSAENRFIIDHAGWELFYEPQAPTDEAIRWTVAQCPESVTTYLVCPNWIGKFYYPCRVGEVMPREDAPYLVGAIERGEDPFGKFLSLLREAGKEVFITYRMNDLHDRCGPELVGGTSQFKKAHPDCVVDPEAAARGTDNHLAYALDYSRPEVRAYILSSLRDLAEQYDLDGVQLDWMRFVKHLPGHTYDEVWAKRDALTRFTAQVREMLDEVGKQRSKRILLAARVPTTPEGCRKLGCDPAAWTRLGLVDFVTPATYLSTDFRIPFEEFRELLGEHQVPLYAGTDYIIGKRFHCRESYAAWALSMYDQGADGINLFNMGCWQYNLAAVPWDWIADLSSPPRLRSRPQLYPLIIDDHMRAYVDQVPDGPTVVSASGELQLTLRLPAGAMPAAYAMLLVAADGDADATINGITLGIPQTDVPVNIFAVPALEEDMSSSEPMREECRSYYISGELLRAGDNDIVIINRENAEITVKRADMGLWH